MSLEYAVSLRRRIAANLASHERHEIAGEDRAAVAVTLVDRGGRELPIEAQACGCPVVCSDRTSLPEVGGDAALVHALDDEAGMAASVRRLDDAEFRAGVVAR